MGNLRKPVQVMWQSLASQAETQMTKSLSFHFRKKRKNQRRNELISLIFFYASIFFLPSLNMLKLYNGILKYFENHTFLKKFVAFLSIAPSRPHRAPQCSLRTLQNTILQNRKEKNMNKLKTLKIQTIHI